jgi:malate dehydrogenase (oxaloacetate-decarboxylating)(NADP+)
MKLGTDFEIVNPEDDPRFPQYWETYHKLMGRRGVTPEAAKTMVRRSNTTIGALMLHLGDADAMICGLVGRFDVHLEHMCNVIGLKRGAPGFATLNALTLDKRTLFITDTYVNEDPSAELLAEHRRDGRRGGAPLRPAAQGGLFVALELRLLEPRLGAQDAQGARPVRADGARHRMRRRNARRRGAVGRSAPHRLPETTLTGEANLLVCPNLDSANILFNVLKMTGGQRHHGRPDPAGRGAGARADAVGDRAAHRQHDGAGGGASAMPRLAWCWPRSRCAPWSRCASPPS